MLASKSKASTSQGVGLVGVCHKSLGLRTFGTDGKKVLADVSPLALSLDVSPVSEGYLEKSYSSCYYLGTWASTRGKMVMSSSGQRLHLVLQFKFGLYS